MVTLSMYVYCLYFVCYRGVLLFHRLRKAVDVLTELPSDSRPRGFYAFSVFCGTEIEQQIVSSEPFYFKLAGGLSKLLDVVFNYLDLVICNLLIQVFKITFKKHGCGLPHCQTNKIFPLKAFLKQTNPGNQFCTCDCIGNSCII